jgi:hypothetical protein
MKTRIAILIVLVAFLLLIGVNLGQAQGSAQTQSSGPLPSTKYLVAQGVASGGHYRLTGLSRQVSGTAKGEGYRLTSPTILRGTGNQCCCTFLPIVQRNE